MAGERSTKNLLISPGFYEVISGEFTACREIEGVRARPETHTLAKLAFAGYRKGTLATPLDTPMDMRPQPHAFNMTPVTIAYTPSWAPTVTAQAIAGLDDHLSRLFGLSLESEGIDGLDVIERPGDERNVLTLIHNGLRNFELEDDESITIARTAVTDAAQSFFDSANAPSQTDA